MSSWPFRRPVSASARLAAEPLEGGRVQKEVLHLLRKAAEHLLGEVVELRPRPAPARIDRPGSGLAGQEEPGDPPLGPAMQLRGHLRLHQDSREAEQLGALLLAERQSAFADLHDTRRPQPGQREREHRAARRRQVGVGREVLRQQAQRRGRRPARQRVHVVDGQHEIVRDRGHHLVAQLGHHLLDRALEGQLGGDPREPLLQGDGEVGQEGPGPGDALVARQPHPGNAPTRPSSEPGAWTSRSRRRPPPRPAGPGDRQDLLDELRALQRVRRRTRCQ